MQLFYRCEWCGSTVQIHKGRLVETPYGSKLSEKIAKAHDSHKCMLDSKT